MNDLTEREQNIVDAFKDKHQQDFIELSDEEKQIKEQLEPDDEIESVKGSSDYLKKQGIDIDLWIKRGLKELKRLDNKPKTS